MLEMLLNSKAGASLAGSIGQGLAGGAMPSTMTSGGQMDARSFMDGSGWTVSTGKSNTTGATGGGGASMGQPMQVPVQQAAIGWPMWLLLGGVAWAMLKR